MRKLFLLSTGFVFCLFLVNNASAQTMTSTYNFFGDQPNSAPFTLDHPDFEIIHDNTTGNGIAFQWTHSDIFSPPAATVDQIMLSIRHRNTNNNVGLEIWKFGTTSPNQILGTLASSGAWVEDSWDITVPFTSGWGGSSFSLGLALGEMTPGELDAMFLDYSRVEITYTPDNPVPEPATIMLFGIGLLGLAGVNRRKK